MKEKIKLSWVLQIMVLICAAILLISVWPLKLWNKKVVDSVDANEIAYTQTITDENTNIEQEFIPDYNHVNKISVLINQLGNTFGRLHFRLFNQDNVLIFESEGYFEENGGENYLTFPVNSDVFLGQVYTYTISNQGTPFQVAYSSKEDYVQNGNRRFYDETGERTDRMAVSQYDYTVSLSRSQKLFTLCMILAIACVLLVGIWIVFKVGRINKSIDSNKGIRSIGIVALILPFLYSFYQVGVKQVFTTNPLDVAVLLLGVIFFFAIAIYIVLQIRIPKKKEQVQKKKKDFVAMFKRCLQVIFFACAMVYSCQFLNAIVSYEQEVAKPMITLFFGLAIIASFNKKELLNLWNILYVIIAAVCVFQYVKPLEGDAYQIGIRFALMIAVWGVVVLNTIYRLIKRDFPKLDWIATLLTTIFFILMLVFRNENTWQLAAVIPFALFYIRNNTQEKMDQWMVNLSDGIILSFIIMCYQALRYRPFHNFRYMRYPGMFHTVTFTTVYYALVFIVVLVKLINAYKKSGRLKDTYPHLLLLGIVCGFQFLTLSRTGILASAVVYVAVMFFYFITNRQPILEGIRKIVYAVLSIVICIPIVFGAVRTIPAVVNDPFIFEGELFDESIQIGEVIDSRRYITVERFLGLSSERILGKVDVGNNENITISSNGIEIEDTSDILNKDGTIKQGVVDKYENLTVRDETGIVRDVTTDYTNGRMDILKAYLGNLNFTGHKAIGLTLESGETIIHAHNSFVQVFYDNGILCGVIFLILCVVMGIRSILYYLYHREDRTSLLPFAILVGFAITGAVEYVFRPMIPLGFTVLFIFTPLLRRIRDKKQVEKQGKPQVKTQVEEH